MVSGTMAQAMASGMTQTVETMVSGMTALAGTMALAGRTFPLLCQDQPSLSTLN
jgi:hypothetical protein